MKGQIDEPTTPQGPFPDGVVPPKTPYPKPLCGAAYSAGYEYGLRAGFHRGLDAAADMHREMQAEAEAVVKFLQSEERWFTADFARVAVGLHREAVRLVQELTAKAPEYLR